MKVAYQDLLKQIDIYKIGNRTESAAFLIWYLVNYYRLDELDAIDAVCDNNGDKGIDGIYVNDSLQTIDVFQTKLSQSDKKSIGDTVLKEFFGTLAQLETKEKINALVEGAGKAQVAHLIRRLDLESKIEAYAVRGVFLSNVDLSSDGVKYLQNHSDIEFIGKKTLEDEYISNDKEVKLQQEVNFDISDTEVTTYRADSDTVAFIAPVRALELVSMGGISDQSIFDYNVRGSLGNTKINRGIVKSIKDPALHKKFPLFHNGITIIADEATKTDDKLNVKNFYVVNGCQSLTSLYKNKDALTPDLKILTKVVKVPAKSDLSEKITEYSNSQNGVKPRDFKSYNQIQIRLQNEVSNEYPNYFYEIKRGEKSGGNKEVISNEVTGVLLMSFDLEQPWNTHRKYQVFEDMYTKLFARPEVNASRIVLLHEIFKIVNDKLSDIDNQLIAKYLLTKYSLIYIVGRVLIEDPLGKKILQSPQSYILNKPENLKTILGAISSLLDDIIIDLNAEIKDLGEDFDYKGKLRDEKWVKELSKKVISSYQKLVSRKRLSSFSQDVTEHLV